MQLHSAEEGCAQVTPWLEKEAIKATCTGSAVQDQGSGGY